MAPTEVDHGRLDGVAEAPSVEDEERPGPRRELVAQLLVFLQQYHLHSQDHDIREMLHDICVGGQSPRPLGRWGFLSSAEVGEAIAAFEVWKADGCLNMPAWYKSQTHKTDIECVVTSRNQDGSLDLCSQLAESEYIRPNVVRKRADPKMVRPRAVENWFVPPMDLTGTQAAAATTASVPAARPAVQEGAVTVQFPFDGTQYGPEYLVLNTGDALVRESEDGGWALGQVLWRSVELPADEPGASLMRGWYPTNFAT